MRDRFQRHGVGSSGSAATKMVNTMVNESAPRRGAAKQRKRVPRGTLSREVIVEAAFRMVDDDAEAELTMSRLGRELGADPSAVYRHFHSKDELLRAMADVMMRDALSDVEPTDDPIEQLRRMAWALRRSFLRRPRLTRVLLVRFTGGEAEESWAMVALRAVESLGFDAATSVDVVRAFGEVTTSHMTLTAEALALPRQYLVVDLERAHNLVGAAGPPLRLQGVSDEELRRRHLEDGDRIFDCALELLLSGLSSRVATRPRRAGAPRTAAKRTAARSRG